MSRTGELRVTVPARVDSLLAEAFAAARLRAKTWLSPGECLLAMATHFVETWAPEVKRRVAATSAVVLRDRGWCQVPGCSRHADHVHHIVPRSAGGSDEPWNLVSLCAIHHLRGVHQGNVAVSGRAPDQLVWILGEKEVAAARR